MKQTLEEAAKENSGIFYFINDYPTNGVEARTNYKHAFRSGAVWRINSVWHRADEKPENDRMVLGIDNGSHPAICGPDNSGWEDTVRIFCITAWAYVDDLLPDTFDEILEANRDVLERIKEKGD